MPTRSRRGAVGAIRLRSLRGGAGGVRREQRLDQWRGVQPDWFSPSTTGRSPAAAAVSGRRLRRPAPSRVISAKTVRRTLFGDDDGIGETIRLGGCRSPWSAPLKIEGPGRLWPGPGRPGGGPAENRARRLSTAGHAARRGATDLGGRGRRPQPGATQSRSRPAAPAPRDQPGDDDDFAVRNINQIVATRTQTTNLMSRLLGAVAGICLVIGGIGIMNIMLVSVDPSGSARSACTWRWAPARATCAGSSSPRPC